MKKNKYLDNEEKILIESFGKPDKNKLTKPSEKEQKAMIKTAKNYLKNESKMNIRIDPRELEEIKKYAEHEGLKYQTFVKSIVHKYITGQLIEKRIK